MKKKTQIRMFAYEAITSKGRIKRGRLAAESRLDVIDVLHADGLTPSIIKPVRNRSWNPDIFPSKQDRPLKLKIQAKAAWARQFHLLIRSGLNLSRSLEVIGEEASDERMTALSRDLSEQVTAGRALSTAMADYPKAFDEVMIAYIRAGEETGDLAQASGLLAEQMERQAEVRRKVVGALTYPVMVGSIITVMVVAVLAFLVPMFEKIYRDLGVPLPTPTQWVMALSRSLDPFNIEMTGGPFFGLNPVPAGHTVLSAPVNWFSPTVWLLATIIGSLVFRRRTANNQPIRARMERIRYRTPLFGGLRRRMVLHRWVSTLSGALHAGMATHAALGIAGRASGSAWLLIVSASLQDAVSRGRPLADAMAEHPGLFSPRIIAMMRSGEEAGEVADMGDAIGVGLQGEVDTTTATLGPKLEVMLLVSLSLVVAGMLVALYLPILSLSDALLDSSGLQD